MKTKIQSVCLTVSSITAVLLLSEANIPALLISFLIGLAIGILFCRICWSSDIKHTKWNVLIAFVITLKLAYEFAMIFYSTWTPSSLVNGMLSRISNNTPLLLKAIALLVACIALPAIFVIIREIIFHTIRLIQCVKWKVLYKGFLPFSSSLLKNIALVICNIAVAAIVGTALLWGAYSLPIETIQENVLLSSNVFLEEGTYYRMFTWCNSQLDNWTDSIMLLEAADDSDGSAIERAMMAYRGNVNDKNPCESLVEHYVNGKGFSETKQYPRYWHGYQIFVKPLLSLTNYKVIRLINGFAQFALFVATCLLFLKRNFKRYIIPYTVSYLMLMPIALANSFQFSACYYVFTLGMILVLLFAQRYQSIFLIFVNLGILTAYFDFLTYPLVTFGVPALVYVLMRENDELEIKLNHMIKNAIAWCCGFGGMWVSKWVVATSLTGYDTFADALGAFSMRTSNVSADGIDKYSIIRCELANYLTFSKTPITVLVVIILIYECWNIVHQKGLLSGQKYRRIFPYILLAAAPVVWFAFATNHSMIHYWFTNKECVITAMALMFGFVELSKSRSTYSITK